MAHAWKACWVQALGGSNPPSSATGPRDRFRFRGFCCLWRRWCCLWCRWCSGRRRARPPARSPHASFARSGRSRSPPVPSGPSGALHTGGACVAWTSPARPCRRPPAPRPGPPDPPAPSTPAALVVLCVPAGNWGVTALLSPGLVRLDSEAFDDLCTRERGQDLARHKELRAAQARADAAPSDRARRVDEEPP